MAAAQVTAGLANPLVDLLEPAFNGGILNPLLAWAAGALPDRLSMSDTPAGVLHRVVSADVNRTGSDSLESVLKVWLNGRLHSHLVYFILSGLLLLIWLVACCFLLGVTLRRERHRRARLKRILLKNDDQVDAPDEKSVARQLPRSQYRRFGAMVIRRVRRWTRNRHQRKQTAEVEGATGKNWTKEQLNVQTESNNNHNSSRNGPNNGYDLTDNTDPWSMTESASTQTTTKTSSPGKAAATEVVRAANLSAKTISGRDHRLLAQTSVATLATLLCVALLVAYCTQAGGILALASRERDANSARSIVSATVGHLDRFLTRALVESNRTIIDTFETAYPSVEKLFTDFGTELLELLMADYGIDKLIGHLEYFLTTVNSTVNTMRDIASARETVIKPLQQFSAQLQVHRDSLQDPLSAVCDRFGNLFPTGHCASLVTRLTELRLGINDTKLETDSSVAIVTLLNKMVKLDIDNVQKQVQKAKESLSTGLQAISGVVRQLLNGLVDTVSSQFEQAELSIAVVKAGFDRAARDPDLWDAVETAGQAVLILVILSCIVFLLTCAKCCILLWALARYLRTACRLDRMPSVVVVAVPTQGPAPVELSANSSPLRRSSASSTTSGFSSGGFSSPRWSPRFVDRSVGFTVVEHEDSSGRFSRRRQKLRRLQDREWKGFTYCCSFDCSVAMLVGAIVLLLPLMFSLALFYATGELQVDVCRYLASSSGNRVWDARLDEFTETRLWPLVKDALDQRTGLPISLPARPPGSLIATVRGSCGDPNSTLFSVFGLTGLLNATALLSSNLTQSQFLTGPA
ncbi:hypothetical protein BOX15_Mlig032820g1 [Macrostomum lignano]|uniref:Uncharacterized protein n=1 Tax=Macrostomum lignano TaxID=282301 RepID=A0A267E3C6_9PLAT|nr:hypothetical protein BOX15_Mlig032820g1 [Macrostomum lignano]